MWGPFVGGHVAGSDRWWKPVIYWLLKNVLLILSVHCSYKQWSEWLQVRDYPGHPPSLINGNFTYPVHLCTRGGGKKKKRKTYIKDIRATEEAIKASLGKKLLRWQVRSLGFRRGLIPPREGSGGGTPAPPDRCSDPAPAPRCPAGHFQPDQPAAPRGGGASAALGGAARAGNKGLTAAGAGRGAQPGGARWARQPVPPARPSAQQ